ncbi:MAG TPA: RluA family pseudouridine synthase [Bryobacteraceae bacterium]|jgi:23S rRNA pseudouridine1911/1915/1917 synthase|nr:RluA family pseudouridine synthase [Bryobacteraceae bacterium]
MRRPPAFKREIVILYEDDAVIAVDKPAGLPAVPIPGSEAPSALAILIAEMKRQRQRALVVHRIDRFTSGALLFAKTSSARDVLVRQFLKHTPVRQYLAVVRGRVEERDAKLVHYLRRSGMFQQVSREQDPEAARAELSYTVEQPLRHATLVRVTLVTGLQNQIRVQLAAAGHPVIGDRKYRAEEAEESRIARVALHAAYLEFIHPVTREKVIVESKLPGDMRSLITSLHR